MGFKWKKSIDNRKLLVDRSENRELRLRYLRAINDYRKQNRPIIYTDELYIHASHTKPLSWSDGSDRNLSTPISKGQRACIVHAGYEKGFINNALLIFKSGKKTGDYHDDMNYENYERWVKEKLIPNLPSNSVVVIDNASYHNVQLNRIPNSNSRKADMTDWLTKNNIPFTSDMCKPELYRLIKLSKSRFKTFKIDSVFAEHGHSVLRLPPYSPELNPIEMIWALIKEYVAKKNVNFKLNDAISLVEEKVNLITNEEWESKCNHVRKIEETCLSREPLIDNANENFIIDLGNDSDDSGSNVETSDEDSENDLSGIVPL